MPNCQRGRRGGRPAAVQAGCGNTLTLQQAQALEGDVPVRRYPNPIETKDGGSCACQLRELNRILDHQNELLGHILALLTARLNP